MKWRDGHAATLMRYGGRLPREREVKIADVLIPNSVLEEDGPGPLGRWRVLLSLGPDHPRSEWVAPPADDPCRDNVHVVAPIPDGVPRKWDLWDMRTFVAGTGQPEAVALGLSSPRTAVLLAEALDGSRVLRMAHAGLTGLSRTLGAMRREWRT